MATSADYRSNVKPFTGTYGKEWLRVYIRDEIRSEKCGYGVSNNK